jgi:hypothetical protein
MALLGSPRISGLVLLDAVGIEVQGHPVADVSTLSVRGYGTPALPSFAWIPYPVGMIG